MEAKAAPPDRPELTDARNAVTALYKAHALGVLIGVIPDSGDGRVGVISGNEFTPLPAAVAAAGLQSGTW